ncbi:hypothetical protein [Saccharothrix xinjiangensis]|uniref:Uncharacterized protein n=1 Tax=Saccharothrix xinjiangensis TaxID=204798 RepID=A0ABV9Y1C5_9PSEU
MLDELGRWLGVTRDELLFNAWLSSVNTELARYIVRLVDESAHASPPPSGPSGELRGALDLAEVEAALAFDLAEVAKAIALKASGQPYPRRGRMQAGGPPARPDLPALAAAVDGGQRATGGSAAT